MANNIQAAQLLPALDSLRIYWYQVSLVLTQLDGVVRGYQAARGGSQPHIHPHPLITSIHTPSSHQDTAM